MRSAGRRPRAALLDDQLVLAFAAALAQRPRVLERGDRPVLRERALVTARELARVQRDRDHLSLRDHDLDPPADKVGVQRVVVGVEPQMRIRRDPRHPAAVQIGLARGQRPHHLAFLEQPVDRPSPQRLVRATVRLLKPDVELQLESKRLTKQRPGSKFVSRYLQSLDAAFACGSRASQNSQSTGSWPQNPA